MQELIQYDQSSSQPAPQGQKITPPPSADLSFQPAHCWGAVCADTASGAACFRPTCESETTTNQHLSVCSVCCTLIPRLAPWLLPPCAPLFSVISGFLGEWEDRLRNALVVALDPVRYAFLVDLAAALGHRGESWSVPVSAARYLCITGGHSRHLR